MEFCERCGKYVYGSRCPRCGRDTCEVALPVMKRAWTPKDTSDAMPLGYFVPEERDQAADMAAFLRVIEAEADEDAYEESIHRPREEAWPTKNATPVGQ